MGVALQDWLLNTNTRARARAGSKVCQKLISAHMSQARRRASFGRWVFLISERACQCVREAQGDRLSCQQTSPPPCPPSHCPSIAPAARQAASHVLKPHCVWHTRGLSVEGGTIQPHPVQRAAVLAAWTPAPLAWTHCHTPTRCTLHTHWHSAHSAPATSL